MAIDWTSAKKQAEEKDEELKKSGFQNRTTQLYTPGVLFTTNNRTANSQVKPSSNPQTSGGTSTAGWVDALFSLPGKAVDAVKNADRQTLLEKRNTLEARRDALRSANVGGVGTFSHANDSNATRIRELDDEIASVDRFLDLQNQIELQPYEQKVTPAREALSKHSIQTNLARRSRGFTYEDAKRADEKASELRREVEKKQRGVEGIKYKQNYQDITQDSSFTGQFSANYDIGQMGEDEALAWNTYLNDPTEENRIYAESVSAAREAYMARNQEALEADTGNSWISKDLAGYLPQFLGQNIAGIKGGLGGAAAGTVLPVAGTAAGAKAGYAAGRALYGYETARGRVFKSLLDAGVPEDQARLAANDEAIVSSVIEGGDAVIDMLTLGFGNLLKKGGTAAAKSTLPKILRNYGINIGSEGLQEWTQEGVSIANQKRNDTGILNLVQESAGQMGRAISGQDPEALEQMNQAGLTGLKIAAMMGGGGIAFNTALSKATSPLMLPTADQETGYQKITEQDAINQFNQNVNNRTAFVPDNPLVNTLPTVSDALYYAPGSPAYRGAQTAQSAQTQQQVNMQPSAETSTQRRQGVQIPVQERTWQDAGNRKVNAFQYDHPELRPYYAEAARALKYDLVSSTKGERFPIFDANSTSGKDIIGYTGTKRSVTDPIAQALDNANLSYAQIDKVIDDLIADNGQENYAAAKKLELVLDDMLTNGYTDSDGYTVPPNQEYIAARDNVNAGFSADNAEYRMSEAEFNAAVARDPAAAQLAEQLSKSFYAGDITQEEYSGAMDLMKAQLLPTVESLPTVGPESSVGAARKGFDPYSAFLGTKSEFFPEGANAARPVDVPTTDAEGNPIRKTAATAMGAKAIPDNVVLDIQNMVMNGDLSYQVATDKAAITRAISTIQADGFQRSLQQFSDSVQKGVVSKDMAALGQQLLVNAANAGDSNATAEILSLYAQMETVAGQAVQAASILRKLSPTAQLYAAQKVASNLEKTLSKQLKGENITINPDLITEFNEQTTQEGRDAVMEKIYKDLASQVPSTWKDKWNAWRYLSMLGNPRTHIRNIFGNVGFQPVRFMKDRIAAVIESGVSAASGGKLQRTKSFATNPALYAAAWQDYKNVSDVLSGNKYDDVQSIINNNRTIFKTKPLEALRKANTNALSIEDMWFKRITYADALAGYLAANGVTVEEFLKMKSEDGSKKKAIYQEAALPAGTRVRAADRNNFGEIVSFDEGTNKYLVHFVSPSGHEANVNLDASLVFPVNRSAQKVKVRNESGEVLPSFLQAARDYAGQEALKATYNDKNAVSDRAVQIARSLGVFGEAVLPFKRTPANILVRGFEYSPLGLAKGLTYDLYQVKQGNMTGAQAIDNIAAGMTGTGLMLLGGLLAAAGIVSGGAGDDEKQAQFNELTGGQTYALNLPGGGSVTLDWLAPEALPFFMGVQAMESFGEEGLTGDTITSAFASISEPMLEMSMLQSLNDLIDNVSYAASNEKLSGLVGSSLISYLTQAIPTIGGQIERTFEDKRYSTYTNKDSLLPTDIQYALGKASAKIPGWDFQQIPYIDEWGRTESTGPLPLRAFNNFLNPAYTSQENVTPLDAEIQRIYDATGDKAVIPNRADKEITVATGVKMLLTGDEYVRYATKRGQMSFEIGTDLLNDDVFQGLTDQQKADVLDDAYSYADATAKASISAYQPEDWITETADAGIDPATAILYKYSDAKSDAKREMLMNDPDLTADQKKALDLALISDKSKIDYTNEQTFALSHLSDAGQEKWAKAEAWGMPYEDYVKYYPICSKSGKGMTKAVVIQNLIDAGMSQRDAYNFWDLIRNG